MTHKRLNGRVSAGQLTMPMPEIEAIRNSSHAAVSQALRQIREAFHRRARLGDPNEALDELAKLLFAHSASLANGLPGISSLSMPLGEPREAAKRLREFVQERASRFLPEDLSHELTPRDFELKLRDSEFLLATEIIGAFDGLNFSGGQELVCQLDIINEIFGRFLTDVFVNQREMGQYLTPPEVVDFMVSLAIGEMSSAERDLFHDAANCEAFGVVMDPSCGVGSFLLQFMRRMQPAADSHTELSQTQALIELMLSKMMVGIDKSERMIRLALINIAIYGSPARNLHLLNGLVKHGRDASVTEAYKGRAGLILTNPPFGAEYSGDDLTEYELAKRLRTKSGSSVNSEILFFERYLEWLRPGGQIVAIVPDSILTNKGPYQVLRDYLAEHVDVRAVISLPSDTFAAAGTSTKTSILHLRKLNGGKQRHRVSFAVCENIGFQVVTRNSQRVKVHHSAGDLPKILDRMHRKVHGQSERIKFDPANATRWDAEFHTHKTKAGLPDSRLVVLSEIADIVSLKTDPRKLGATLINYIEISDVEPATLTVSAKAIPASLAPSRARKQVRAGDVLVSTVRPERKAVGVVGALQDGYFCTTGFAVIRPRAIRSIALALLLQSDVVTEQLVGSAAGIAYPAIDENILNGVRLPITIDAIGRINDATKDLAKAQEKWFEQRRRADEFMGNLPHMSRK